MQVSFRILFNSLSIGCTLLALLSYHFQLLHARSVCIFGFQGLGGVSGLKLLNNRAWPNFDHQCIRKAFIGHSHRPTRWIAQLYRTGAQYGWLATSYLTGPMAAPRRFLTTNQPSLCAASRSVALQIHLVPHIRNYCTLLPILLCTICFGGLCGPILSCDLSFFCLKALFVTHLSVHQTNLGSKNTTKFRPSSDVSQISMSASHIIS